MDADTYRLRHLYCITPGDVARDIRRIQEIGGINQRLIGKLTPVCDHPEDTICAHGNGPEILAVVNAKDESERALAVLELQRYRRNLMEKINSPSYSKQYPAIAACGSCGTTWPTEEIKIKGGIGVGPCCINSKPVIGHASVDTEVFNAGQISLKPESAIAEPAKKRGRPRKIQLPEPVASVKVEQEKTPEPTIKLTKAQQKAVNEVLAALGLA